MMKLLVFAAILAVATARPSFLEKELMIESIIHGEPHGMVEEQTLSEEDREISKIIRGEHLTDKDTDSLQLAEIEYYTAVDPSCKNSQTVLNALKAADQQLGGQLYAHVNCEWYNKGTPQELIQTGVSIGRYDSILVRWTAPGKTCVVQNSNSCSGVQVWDIPIGYGFFPATIGTNCIHVQGMPRC